MVISMKLSCEYPFGQEWIIDKEIGKGSYGVVYQLSRNDAGSRITSAMKWIPLPGDESEIQSMYAEGQTRTAVREYYEKLKAGFSEEIQLLYRLRGNSHIVSLEDYKIIPREGDGAVGYDIYIRMELLVPLEKWLLKQKEITYRDIVQIGIDLCDALNDCSRFSIIHRDIKPDNIFVTDDNRFKLGDFGIARRLQGDDLNASQRVGSLGYMSPEVFHAQSYDHRADIYSLGLVLYKLVNDRREPFAPPAPEIVTPQAANKANETRLNGVTLPKPEKIPESLERLWDIIQKACEYQPSNRYQTPIEMKSALQSIEALPALDEPVFFSCRNTKAEPAEKGEAEPPATSTEEINGTRYRTPSSVDLNQTSPRTSVSNNQREETASKPRLITQSESDTKETKKTLPIKWIIIAAVAILLVIGVVVLLTSGKHESGEVSTGWAVKTEKISTTSVVLSWSEGPKQDVICNCYQNEICIRPEFEANSPLTVSGLVPGTEYLFVLSSGNESDQLAVTTEKEAVSEQIPLVQRVDLFSINVKYLEDKPISQVDESYFDYISDNILHLRSGPVNAQVSSPTVWIRFQPITGAQPVELILSMETADKAVFSRSTVLNLSDSEKPVTYRASLDELLGDIYSWYHGWPKDECSLRLYIEGMSVYEIAIRFESAN